MISQCLCLCCMARVLNAICLNYFNLIPSELLACVSMVVRGDHAALASLCPVCGCLFDGEREPFLADAV